MKYKHCLFCKYSIQLGAEDQDSLDDYHDECKELVEEARQEILDRRLFAWDSLESVGKGWTGILATLVLALRQSDPDFSIHQIKEKFGGLRFYVGGMSRVGHNLINMAESYSYQICEVCGNHGKAASDNGWVRTLCEPHRERVLSDGPPHSWKE